MSNYSTKQRKVLLSYLAEHTDEQLSAKQIAQALENENISQSAVYRNLAALEGDGKIRRSSKDLSREIFYSYVDTTACKDHLHLSCKKCGKTIHMNNDEAEMIVRSVASNEKFAIDKTNTVLYGICDKCQK